MFSHLLLSTRTGWIIFSRWKLTRAPARYNPLVCLLRILKEWSSYNIIQVDALAVEKYHPIVYNPLCGTHRLSRKQKLQLIYISIVLHNVLSHIMTIISFRRAVCDPYCAPSIVKPVKHSIRIIQLPVRDERDTLLWRIWGESICKTDVYISSTLKCRIALYYAFHLIQKKCYYLSVTKNH